MKKPRNRFKLSINLEKVRYEVRHYKTYKGRIEKNTRTTLPEKYFKFVVHLQTIGMVAVDNLLSFNSIEIDILISKQIGFLLFS